MITAPRFAPAAPCVARALRLVAAAALVGSVATAVAAPPPPGGPPGKHRSGTRLRRSGQPGKRRAAPVPPVIPTLLLPAAPPSDYEPPPDGAPEYEPPPSALTEYEPPPSEAPEYEPPPSEVGLPPKLLPPKLPPRQPSRVYFELGLSGAALVNRGVYGFGGELDLGARFRLPFGALGVALRLGLEQHIQPEPAPFLMNLGVAVTYLLGRPHWRLSPYVGVWAQGMLQRLPESLGAIPLQRDQSGLTLGGLAGAQLRLGRGGIFTELGYRQTVYRQTAAVIPAWNTVQLLLGYRFVTN